MEIEKVIRILSVFIVLSAFAVQVASRLLFPDAGHASDLPIAIMMAIALMVIWRDTSSEKKKTNK